MTVYKAVRLAPGQLCCLFHIFRDLNYSATSFLKIYTACLTPIENAESSHPDRP